MPATEERLLRDRVFTPHKRRLLRKKITTSETVFGGLFILATILATIWVGAQSDNYDPADRDISFELLQEDANTSDLYNTPLQRWVEPGSRGAVQAGPDITPFPAGFLSGGWELDGRVEVYDAENLYEKINGAAPQYMGYGFKNLYYMSLALDGHLVSVELYDQGEFKNVLGIFSDQRSAGREVLRNGEVFYYRTPVGFIGGYRNYYFKIAGNTGADAILSKSESALALIPELSADSQPTPRAFSVLAGDLGVPFDGLEFQKTDVFQYAFLSEFWFGAVADGDEARYFIHEPAADESTEELFRRLRSEQENEYDIVESSAGRALMKHRYLDTYFTMGLTGGANNAALFGVEGAPNAELARKSLSKLEDALNRG